MARLYTPEEIQDALRELRIAPDEEGRVTTKEAAAILTWRAGQDGNPHSYPEAAVRSRSNDLKPVATGWANRYRVEDVFRLTLYPKKGIKPASKEATQSAK